jgi:hypothetical protein
MADRKQKRTKAVPWADHTEPTSEGAANVADQDARIDPDELGEAVSPGQIAASDRATPKGGEPGTGRVRGDDPESRERAPNRDASGRTEGMGGRGGAG